MIARCVLLSLRLIHLLLFIVVCLNLSSSASTVALVSGSATQDGRPLLMKNRDNEIADQEYVYDHSGLFAYVGVSYTDVTNQCWGGINEVGFAIINSNAWNFDDLVAGPDDDGFIMRVALQTCVTIEDFQAVMDSTNVTGRTRCANYGVVDSTGAGAFFEAASYEYYRFNLNDSSAAPNGYMARANFAYAGGPYHLGQHRHDRVLTLLDSASYSDLITPQYLTQVILRDLVNEENNPYPLPFAGREGLIPYGLLHTHDCINREISRSGMAIQGIVPGENPLLGTVWALVGEPITICPVPLWVHAGSVPPEFDSPGGSSLNRRAQEIRDYLYQEIWDNDALDTWRLLDDRGQGWLPYLTQLDNLLAARGDSALQVWRTSGLPAAPIVAAVQNSLAAQALSTMESWAPPQNPQVTLNRLPTGQVQLNWTPVTQDVFGRPITVSSYTIYRSTDPFYDRLIGDSLMTVTLPPVTLSAADTVRFFQVRSRP